ncbi:unnamed protein product [Cladocopium goreaui]|uniref:Fucoxanthin-chlorophyll a-c binding protein F, chloroplastic n=1 Tax=Cladocopium goreaui TaxID=2562237 RepID=A0A9P1C6G3_9DINO|nr:unnamed protein product [Cladocopium goreaui]
MASKKCGAAIGLASAVAGSAFIAGTGSTKSSALRGVRTQQAQTSPVLASTSASTASTASYAAASVVAASAGVVLATRPGAKFSKTTVTALKAFEQELGVQPPVGFWDPLGLSKDGDVEAFKRRRSVELKHGRIAMLATMGYITPEIAGKFPGYLSPSAGLKFADVPNGLAAISKVPPGGWTQILLYMGWCEVSRGPGSDIASGRPGDFGWYVLTSADPEQKKQKLNAELANGRLAMMAIIGMFYQDGLTGSAWGDWSLYTDSPLRAFENETGVQPPVGFWDPLGLSVSGNLSDYKRRREVELKHGRVAMFATIGYILPEYWRFPGYLSKFLDIKFSEVPNGLSAFSKVPALGWLQIVGFAGIVELNVYNEQVNDEPGNYGAGFLGLRSIGFMNAGIADPEVRKKKLNAELANGRLAMFAIIGMFFQDGLTGSAWGDWANYTDSPLRAFEGELGVQPPVGFWDPLGLSSDGDLAVFKRRREVELKHGRISMFAAMGYITPEYFKFPGELSPKLGLKFADIPNGLAAISKVPGQGWAQIVAFLGTYELFINKPVGDEPGNYGKGNLGLGFLGPVKDPEARKRKLSAELANGRLAMMAIIGMFFQDGLTGSAWGDWALYTDSPLRSGVKSPGYNTLPEWEKPKTGFEGLVGDQAPVGFWDPLGLSKDKDLEVFKRLGCYIAPEYYRFDGYLSPSMNLKFSDVPNGLKALSVVPKEGWAQILAFAGFLELVVNKKTSEPGNYGKGNLGLGLIGFGNSVQDPETRTRKLNAELANGRLAMMAIIGMFFQDGLTGSAWGDWANYTDSPLRAFEGELGVQPPVGFWDPLGLSSDGDLAVFKRRREVELKHGRISMFAAMGYITPEYFKFPGELSPKLGLKFADIPNGLAAISKVPGQGWAQIVAFLGTYELFINKPVGDEPGNYGKGNLGLGFLGPVKDPEARKKKLSAELANGRLAMMAIIGMFFQDGLTGSAWGDWALYTDSPLRSGVKSPGYNTLPEWEKPKTGFEGLVGDQAPVGFWDPLGLSKDNDLEVFKRRRETEIKHGRVAMFATMGYIAPEYYRFDGYLSPSMNLKFSDVPNGLKALSVVPKEGWAQILAFAGFLELVVNKKTSEPGNYGKGNLGLGLIGFGNSVQDPETRTRKLNAELANGRLAMMAIIGMFFQDGLTGSAWGDWANYTDSPLRAFEGELGVQPPVGFWDPLGLSSDGDLAVFKRRREVELKHGRISMFAAMGYITPEYFKFPGELSPKLGLKFADIPNGLAAISKVPGQGWAQIVAFLGTYELFINKPVGDEPGNYGKGNLGLGFLGPVKDPEARKKKLSAELANGRLAMMAIIGMFFQDGLTGSAWGDWALYTDSPLRSGVKSPGYNTLPEWEKPKTGFEGLVGDQAPVGFWDPLGLSKDNDLEVFKRRRETEIKHGRVAMFATMGYIAPEYYRFDGYLSPSMNLKFSDVPNGLKALSVVPKEGWAQILAFAGFLELVVNKKTSEPGNYGKGNLGLGLIGFGNSVQDPETRTRKLNAELANGRLAMMAIIGMFFQDGLTGSAWGDWANYTMVDLLTRRGLAQGTASHLKEAPFSCAVPFRMASKRYGAVGVGLAGAVAGSAFIASPGSQTKNGALRATRAAPQAASASASSAASTASYAAASVVAASAGVLLTRRPGAMSKTTVTALQAFEQELGVQPPVGFWDPAGLSKDGDVEAFKRRRSVELKHGRIAMLATMGYITPEIAGKFPGYLSPSAGLKFADVPNGLAAISKVPAGGWTQILLYMGWCEVSRGPGSDIASGRPGDFGWYVLTSADPEKKTQKLNAELANGRLAMMAIIGMFYQDGLTGSAWGDWSLYTDSPLRAFENETGVQPPVGFWDPLGLSVSGNLSDYKRRREVELKHGRVAMFATIGYILPEYWRFPGYLSKFLDIKFSEVPNGLSAFSKVPALGWLQIVGFAGIVELNVYNEQVNDEPGNYGAGFLGLRSIGFMNAGIADPEVRKKKLNAELANGRLAMFAIIGMFFQDGLTGSAWGDWANYTDSPLRAFEGELGVQPPVGFWDPLGLSSDGDLAVFKRRREVELKHGRISMFAAMGYITPEYFKFPGELSPKLGLKFADIPNGLAAISKVPGQGWAQIVALLGTYELFINKPVGDEPGNYGKGNLGLGFLGPVKDPEARKRKLSAELANGRLAMMAIIGMFFQDGLTGSAWGDWALYTDSPLRSGVKSPGYNTLPEWEKPKTGFEGLVGDQAPVGFWDPLGLSKDKDLEVFKRRRETEIKHGRVAMFATMGYIAPEYYRFDGYLSPSMNLKFSDVPNGLKALSVVPKEGWAQILAFAGFLELVVNKKTSEPGNYGKGNLGLGLIGFGNSVQDPETRTRKLNAELANGRLAMMAIIGMFFQDGLTGSAWGDWALYTDSPLRSGVKSPGYNTLPEWEKPKTGFEGLVGDQAPVGFWDPLGLSKDKDLEVFKRRRETEIKHGRVAMFATMGYIAPEYYRFDGYLSPSMNLKFSDVPNGLKALSVVPKEGWAQILAFAGFLELVVNKKTSEPGNYGKGNLGLGLIGFGNSVQDPETRTRKLNAELANGRLAMMAIIGMFFQDGLTGSAWGDWALYTDSPLRAFENELGVQAPVGFWDPLGFTKGDDAASFRRRRYVELKHGRVAMFACLGYIVPEYYRWPGDLSPSLGLKFSDVPTGFAAFSKVPLSGWAQMVAFAGTVELFQYVDDPKRPPGDFENAGFLGIPNGFVKINDPEVKQKKLAAELANGRLAMMAIIGMFFQNGLTGEAWGDWSLYTDSPLRAFEGELGVQAPVGFWDPLGLSADGDVDTFKRRRAAELKHGRICMLACIGYIVPEYFRWPGYLSPEKGIKFADMPHGIAAISKVPLEGWVQIVLFLGHYEGYFWRQDPKRAPGDYEGYGFLGAGKNFIFNFDPIEFKDPEVRKTKLAAEIANGRLAMVALMAMLFQNGTVGTTGPAMWLPAA